MDGDGQRGLLTGGRNFRRRAALEFIDGKLPKVGDDEGVADDVQGSTVIPRV
jgi:hypothetical protein